MFEDQLDTPTEESEGGSESSSPNTGDGYVEPQPQDYGITLGSDSCIDDCWAEFQRCCNTSRNAAACLGAWQTCIRACGERVDAGATPSE